MEHWENFGLENLTEEYEGVIYYEEWRDVEGYEGRYQISSFGRVKSFVVAKLGRIRKGVPAVGYLQVQLKGNGDGTFESGKIHRMVAKAFIPNPLNLPEVNHKKGNRKDNRVWMIEWSTPSDNVKHAYRELGKRSSLHNFNGEIHYKAKYKNSEVIKMREMYFKEGKTLVQIADIFKDNRKNIYRIVNKIRYVSI